jgi:hypothetical protein
MTLLDTLTAAPHGSTNLSPLATKAYRTQVAPKPRVGMRVHVYGPQGVAYYRARVFDVSGRGVRVVGVKKDETLSPEDWKARVREENPFDHLFVPAFLRPAEPPALPPEIQRAETQKHTVRNLAILAFPVVTGAAIGKATGVGAGRGAAAGVGVIAGATLGYVYGGKLGSQIGMVAGGTSAAVLGSKTPTAASALGAATGAAALAVDLLLSRGARG